MGYNNVTAMDGWTTSWKMRHDIEFKKAHGEKGSADFAEADE